MKQTVLKVLLADDHDVMREGLRYLLEQHDDMQVIGEASNGRQAIEQTRQLKPDVLLIDIGMPDLNGIDATRKVLQRCPDTRVLCLSMHDERQLVVSMLQAGASGYLVKSCAGSELVDAIRTVAAGNHWLSPAISGYLIDECMSKTPERHNGIYQRLTMREREILQLIAEGRNTKEVADLLQISDKTVAAHRLKLMEKTGCESVADLTRYAIRQGLIQP